MPGKHAAARSAVSWAGIDVDVDGITSPAREQQMAAPPRDDGTTPANPSHTLGLFEQLSMTSLVLQDLKTYGPHGSPTVSLEEARAYTRRLTEQQYENFTVVSFFLPPTLRSEFHAVYSFCRWADDLGDEVGDRARSTELLSWWRAELAACYAGLPRHPVFVALAPVIERHDIPQQPFDDLIDAFVQDQSVTRYDTWEQVLDYCTRSADPVGRLVLYLCDYRDAQRQQLSDATCTALQLANFWQDVRRDVLERDRVYIPRDVAHRHGLDIDLMVKAITLDEQGCAQRGSACCPAGARVPSAGIHALLPAYRATLRELVERTAPLFAQGRALWPLLAGQVRTDVKLFTLGGEAVLRMIRRLDYNTLQTRPSLSKGAKLALMLQALGGTLLNRGWGRSAAAPRSSP